MENNLTSTSTSSWWHSGKKIDRATGILAVSLCIYNLLFVMGVFSKLNIYILSQQHKVMNLAVVIVILYLNDLFNAKNTFVKYSFNSIFLLMGIIPCVYIFVFYDTVVQHVSRMQPSTLETVLFFMLLASLLEAARRKVGWPMALIALFFVFYAFKADMFPGVFFSRPLRLPRLVSSFYLSTDAIFSVPIGVASTTVAIFLIFACLLLYTGGGKFFIDLSMSLMGMFRGGPAKTAILASATFGTLSGPVAANVAATGSITIPLMKRIGYKPEFAAGVEAVASNGGQLMPPIMGVAAFVMAEMTGIPYVKIIAAALIPAILYYIALFTQVDLEAVRLKLKGLPKQELPQIKQVLKDGWFYIVPLVVLIVALAVFRITPERSAFYAMVALVLLVILNRKFSIRTVVDAFENAGKAMCVVVVACATAGLILGTISTTGVGINLAIAIERISAGNVYLILLLTAFSCLVLGTGLDTISIYFMLSTLISPLLVDSGITLMAAHLFVVYYGLVSFITPPVAVAAFIAAGLAESNPMKTAVSATRLGICTFIIPFLFVLNPELLMIGSGGDIALAFVTAVAGVFVLSMGIVGRMYHDIGEIPPAARIIFIGCALLMMQPGIVTDLIGISVTALTIWFLIKRSTKQPSTMEGVRQV